MSLFSIPTGIAAGQRVRGSDLAAIASATAYLLAPPVAQLYHTSAQAIPNNTWTALLFGTLGAFVLAASWLIFGRSYGALMIGLLIALAMNGIAYYKSDTIAIKAMRARPVSEAEQPAMYRIVRELSTAARQPMPRLYVSPTAPAKLDTSKLPSIPDDALAELASRSSTVLGARSGL